MGYMANTSLIHYYPNASYSELGETMMLNNLQVLALTCTCNMMHWIGMAEWGNNKNKEHLLAAQVIWTVLWGWHLTAGDTERVAAGMTYENGAGWLLIGAAQAVCLYLELYGEKKKSN